MPSRRGAEDSTEDLSGSTMLIILSRRRRWFILLRLFLFFSSFLPVWRGVWVGVFKSLPHPPTHHIFCQVSRLGFVSFSPFSRYESNHAKEEAP